MVDYRRLHVLFGQLSKKIEEQHTLYLDCIIGFATIHDRVLDKQHNIKLFLSEDPCGQTEFQDTCSISYKELCGKDYSVASLRPTMKQGDVKNRTIENGKNYWLLGAQCVVAMYSYWEEYLRIEIAKALGTEIEKIRHDIWGDLRLLRNCIIHNASVAFSDIENCKIIKLYKQGDQIQLNFNQMRGIFNLLAIYRNELHSMSLPPSKGIVLSSK